MLIKSAVLEITHTCNFNCSHCYLQNKEQYSMNWERWNILLHELADLGCLSLVITGGEVFTRRDLLYNILKKANEINYSVTIITNGELITAEDCMFMKENGVDKVIVTLYGYHDASISNTTRTFKKKYNVYENILLMKNKGLNIETQTTIVKTNINDIELIRNWTKQNNIIYGVDGYIFSSYKKTNTANSIEFKDIQNRANELLLAKKKQIQNRENNSPICSAGRSKICITPTGDILPCPTWRCAMANLEKQSLKTALSCLIFENKYTINNLKKCIECELYQYCSVCPGINFQDTGDPMMPSHNYCEYQKITLR